MLAMSARRSLGTIPYFSSVDHTRAAREAVGPEALVIPEVAYVLDEDVERARATARRYAKLYLGLSNYTNALLDHGFDQADIEDGGSDRLIDHVIPHGSRRRGRRDGPRAPRGGRRPRRPAGARRRRHPRRRVGRPRRRAQLSPAGTVRGRTSIRRKGEHRCPN